MTQDNPKPDSPPPGASPGPAAVDKPAGAEPAAGPAPQPPAPQPSPQPAREAPPQAGAEKPEKPADTAQAATAPANGKPAAAAELLASGQPAPAGEPPAQAKPDAAAPRKVEPVDPADAHVLVVEDNVPNFVLIARLLAYTGVQRCEWKTSGWQVVEFADTLPRIDLILMDIRLPYEDGFQALEKVRSSEHLKDTLVVAVTAEASVEQMKRAQECGFDGFLGKPLDPDRFPDQIRRVLRGEPVWEIH